MYWVYQFGVYFVEGEVGGRTIARIDTELNDFFSQNQLKTLDDLKDRMARHVHSLGGNAVWNFSYGQKSSFFKSFFGMDNVLWHGSGTCGIIQPAQLPPARNA